MTYKRKLANPLWQKKRLEILERDKWTCRLCTDNRIELHVHHEYYTNGLEPWEYKDECYVTLCSHCHSYFEKFKKDFDGLRLEHESEKRAKYTESRRSNGLKGGRPKGKKTKTKATRKHMDNHMEDDNVDYNSLLDMVNKVTGKNIRGVNDKTKGQIRARLSEGYSTQEIDTATNNSHLRSLLFGIATPFGFAL